MTSAAQRTGLQQREDEQIDLKGNLHCVLDATQTASSKNKGLHRVVIVKLPPEHMRDNCSLPSSASVTEEDDTNIAALGD